MTQPFTFSQPSLLWLLATIPLAILAMVLGARSARKRLQRLVPERLRSALVRASSPWLRRLRSGFAIAALALAAIAAAGPLLGVAQEEVRQSGRDVILAVDVSKSMLAPDLTPNRLTRVRLAAQDLVAELSGDRIGVVAFAGRAFLQAPLTLDVNAAIRSIVGLEPDVIPLGGTNIAEAIQIAREAFGDNDAPNRVLVIFSDGEDLADESEQAARTAAEEGIRIFTVGVGTPEGSLVTLPRELGLSGDFIRDERGAPVRSQLDEARLKRIAEIGGGKYLRLGGVQGLDPIVSAIAAISGSATLSETRKAPLDRYQVPLTTALVFLLAAWLIPERRSASPPPAKPPQNAKAPPRPRAPATALAIAAALVPSAFHTLTARAETDPDSVTKTSENAAAFALYNEGQYEEAFDALKASGALSTGGLNAFNTGCAAYKAGDFQAAIEAFSDSLKSSDSKLLEDAHYNLANTLAKLGQQRLTPPDGTTPAHDTPSRTLDDWRSALQHYDAALDRNPGNTHARENRELLRQLIQSLEQQQQQDSGEQQQQQGDQQQQQQGDQQQQQQAGEQQQQAGQQQQQQQDGQGDSQKQQQQDGREQQQQAADPSSDGENVDPPTGGGDERQRDQAAGNPSESRPLPEVEPRDREGELRAADGEDSIKDPAGSPQDAPPQSADGSSPEENGEMTRAQAARLLEALRAEEDRVLLHERTRPERVYKDW